MPHQVSDWLCNKLRDLELCEGAKADTEETARARKAIDDFMVNVAVYCWLIGIVRWSTYGIGMLRLDLVPIDHRELVCEERQAPRSTMRDDITQIAQIFPLQRNRLELGIAAINPIERTTKWFLSYIYYVLCIL